MSFAGPAGAPVLAADDGASPTYADFIHKAHALEHAPSSARRVPVEDLVNSPGTRAKSARVPLSTNASVLKGFRKTYQGQLLLAGAPDWPFDAASAHATNPADAADAGGAATRARPTTAAPTGQRFRSPRLQTQPPRPPASTSATAGGVHPAEAKLARSHRRAASRHARRARPSHRPTRGPPPRGPPPRATPSARTSRRTPCW